MCAGGRIVNYSGAIIRLTNGCHFCRVSSRRNAGRALCNGDEVIEIHDQVIDVKANIYQMSGYSAHAAQGDLVKFVAGINEGPAVIRVVHGDVIAQTQPTKM